MKYETYINLLRSKFERHFHIKTDVEVLGNKIDMLAKYVNISGRTFLTKHDVIDRCENFEYCYIKRYDTISRGDAAAYGQFLKKIADEVVEPGRDHMSTYITGIIISNNISDEVRNEVEKFSYSKAYSFYLKGWCDVRLICIDLDANEVITNRAGRKVKKVYQFAS